jgi:hypothetical protein
MLLIKATGHSEAGVQPSSERIEAMHAYCDKLANAGVLRASEGLYPSALGMRLTYPAAGGKPAVMVGPFEERKGMVAGIMTIEVQSEEQAYEWALQMPDPNGYGEGEVELRQVFEDTKPIRRSL